MPNQGDGAVVLMRRGYVKAVERCHELQRHVALLADQDGRQRPQLAPLAHTPSPHP